MNKRQRRVRIVKRIVRFGEKKPTKVEPSMVIMVEDTKYRDTKEYHSLDDFLEEKHLEDKANRALSCLVRGGLFKQRYRLDLIEGCENA